jgi:hypothetical protein
MPRDCSMLKLVRSTPELMKVQPETKSICTVECNVVFRMKKTKTNTTGLETEITVQVLNKFVVTV